MMVVPNEAGTACKKCDHFACVCNILATHNEKCLYRLATTGVAIECEHGYDVCPRCDPCTCEEIPQPSGAPFVHTMPSEPMVGPALTISTKATELLEEFKDYQWPIGGTL
jgi:hypothetical protein